MEVREIPALGQGIRGLGLAVLTFWSLDLEVQGLWSRVMQVPALPSLSNSWIIIIIWLYIALDRTPNIDCYWVGAVPKV